MISSPGKLSLSFRRLSKLSASIGLAYAQKVALWIRWVQTWDQKRVECCCRCQSRGRSQSERQKDFRSCLFASVKNSSLFKLFLFATHARTIHSTKLRNVKVWRIFQVRLTFLVAWNAAKERSGFKVISTCFHQQRTNSQVSGAIWGVRTITVVS